MQVASVRLSCCGAAREAAWPTDPKPRSGSAAVGTLFDLAMERLKEEDWRGAENFLIKVAQLNPGDVSAKAYLAWAIFRQDPQAENKLDLASRYLREALSIRPDLVWAYGAIAHIARARGWPSASRAWWSRYLQWCASRPGMESGGGLFETLEGFGRPVAVSPLFVVRADRA